MNIKNALTFYTNTDNDINNFLENSYPFIINKILKYSYDPYKEKYIYKYFDKLKIIEHDNLFNSKKLIEIIELIDTAFQNAPRTTTSFIVYRGLKLPYMKNVIRKFNGSYVNRTLNILHGYKSQYKGYISTSLNKNMVIDTFYNSKKEKRSVMLEIEIPIGVPVLFLNADVSIYAEDEILLPRNSFLETIGFSKEGNINILKTKFVLE